MSRISRTVIPLVFASVLAAFWAASGEAGGAKAPVWKGFVPENQYGPLVANSLKRLSNLAEDEKSSLSALRAEALIVAGYTLSYKDGKTAEEIRNLAARVATVAAKDDDAKFARKLARALADGEPAEAGPVKDWRAVIGDIGDVMNLLASRAKKGEGIHPDLQYNDKLKKQNGTEPLINALAAKKLTDTNLGKMSKQLELLGYRVATIGAIALARGPAVTKKGVEPRLWDEQAIVMRDAAVELAQAAAKKNGAAVLAASTRLENSCVECHRNFKQ